MDIIVDNSAIERIAELRTLKKAPDLKLRLIVDGGGCSGFQYKMELTEHGADGEVLFADTVLTDQISLPYLNGATVKYEQKLAGSQFIVENPNAKSGCGCGTSFSL